MEGDNVYMVVMRYGDGTQPQVPFKKEKKNTRPFSRLESFPTFHIPLIFALILSPYHQYSPSTCEDPVPSRTPKIRATSPFMAAPENDTMVTRGSGHDERR